MLLFQGNIERTNEFFVPANHPFNFWTDPDGDGVLAYVPPSDWIPEVHEAVPLGYFGRLLGAEANGESAGDERREFDNLRVMAGLEAELSGGWKGEGYLARARTDLSVNADRHWVADEFARLVAEGLWNPFGTRLVAPGLATPKTVAGDGLAPALAGKRAANDAEVLRRFEGVRMETASSVQEVLEFMASGDLFDWRGRPVSLAVGAHHRRLKYSYQPDPLNISGEGPQEIRDFPRNADQQVWAVFAESLVDTSATAPSCSLPFGMSATARSAAPPTLKSPRNSSPTTGYRCAPPGAHPSRRPACSRRLATPSSRTLTDPFLFDSRGGGRCSVAPRAKSRAVAITSPSPPCCAEED